MCYLRWRQARASVREYIACRQVMQVRLSPRVDYEWQLFLGGLPHLCSLPSLCAEPVFSYAASADKFNSIRRRPHGNVLSRRDWHSLHRTSDTRADTSTTRTFFSASGRVTWHEIEVFTLSTTTFKGKAGDPNHTLSRSRSHHEADAQHKISSQQAERAPWTGRCDGLHCCGCDGWPDGHRL